MPSEALLRVPISHWQTMLNHVLACLPEEACGILAGQDGMVGQVMPVENAEHSSVRFRMEPRAQVDALLELEARGLDLMAIYHSHPSGPVGPSPTDMAEASYPEAASVIWCSENGRWQARAFDLSGADPVQIRIEVVPGA